MVLLLSPVVTGAGSRPSFALIGCDALHRSTCFRSAEVRMRSEPSPLIFYLLP